MKVEYILLVICLLGALQGFAIALLLWFNKSKGLQRPLLSMIFASCALAMLIITLVNAGLVQAYPFLRTIEFFLGFTIGPLIFIYSQSLYQPYFRYQRILIHLLPATIFLIWSFFAYNQVPAIEIPVIMVMLHLQVYVAIGGINYLKHKRWPGFFTKQVDRDWMPLILTLCILLFLSQWVRFSFASLPQVRLVVPTLIALGFYFITVVLMQRSMWFFKVTVPERRYTNEPLDRSKAETLDDLMHKQVHRNPQLSLSKLALAMEIHPYQLTQLIKQQYHCTYTNYVNCYRVATAKKLLSDPQWDHLTIEAIGQEAGFKSRSAFYRVFKNIVNQTPAAFKRSLPR